MFKQYQKPQEVGYLGWFEDCDGNCTAFVTLDKTVQFMTDLK